MMTLGDLSFFMARFNLLSGILYGKRPWMGFLEDFGPKVNELQVSTRELFCIKIKIIFCPFTSVSHILTVTNYQVLLK